METVGIISVPHLIWIGCGGVFYHTAPLLAKVVRAREVTLFDPDMVTASTRQYWDAAIGQPKVVAAAALLRWLGITPGRVWMHTQAFDLDAPLPMDGVLANALVIATPDNRAGRAAAFGATLSLRSSVFATAGNDLDSGWVGVLRPTDEPDRRDRFEKVFADVIQDEANDARGTDDDRATGCGTGQTLFGNVRTANLLVRAIVDAYSASRRYMAAFWELRDGIVKEWREFFDDPS